MENLFDYSQTLVGDVLKNYEEIWRAVPKIKEIIGNAQGSLNKDFEEVASGVFVHKTARVSPLATLAAPCIVCENAEIRRGAFLRGGVLVGSSCVVGASVELKNVIMFDGAKIPHLSYCGDSILGRGVHFGAGAKVSNQKSDKSKITLNFLTQKVDTNLSKFGALVGDGTEVGCNAVLCPGSVVGKNCTIYPLSFVRGFLPQNTIFKQNGKIVAKIDAKTPQKLAFFGTDGFRGKVGEKLFARHAFIVGRVLGSWASGKQIAIGRDTRLSSKMLQSAFCAGATSCGANVLSLGVATTPQVAYQTKKMGAEFGVVISASHNPFEDNGIKLFSASGEKLDDNLLLKIEEHLKFGEDNLASAKEHSVGKILDCRTSARAYAKHLASFGQSLVGLKVGLDCANGSASKIAKRVFASLGASVSCICCHPNGTNINQNCGSTAPERLARLVRKKGLHMGFAFDGDADRVIAVDENGRIVDGDKMLFAISMAMKQNGTLSNSCVAATIASSSGLATSLGPHGIKVVLTQVGDKNVHDAMVKNGLALGGEKAGHIILCGETTGDGIKTAVVLASIAAKQGGKKFSSLFSKMQVFPAFEANIGVKNKDLAQNNTKLEDFIKKQKQLNKGVLRVLVRPSGTQEFIRVLVEGTSSREAKKVLKNITQKIREMFC